MPSSSLHMTPCPAPYFRRCRLISTRDRPFRGRGVQCWAVPASPPPRLFVRVACQQPPSCHCGGPGLRWGRCAPSPASAPARGGGGSKGTARRPHRPTNPLHQVQPASTGTWVGQATRESPPKSLRPPPTTAAVAPMHGFASRPPPPAHDIRLAKHRGACTERAIGRPRSWSGGGADQIVPKPVRLYVVLAAAVGSRTSPHAPSRSGEPVAHCRAFRRGGVRGGGSTDRPGGRPANRGGRRDRGTPTDRRCAAERLLPRPCRPPPGCLGCLCCLGRVAGCLPPPTPPLFPLTLPRRRRHYHPTAVGVVAEAPPPVVASRQPVSGRPARRGDLLPPTAAVCRPAAAGGGAAVPRRRWSACGLHGAAVRGPG